MQFANNTRRGFTLIELMVVITISGLLLGIVTIGTVNSKKSSRDAQRIKDIQVIAKGFESFAADNQGMYPQQDTPQIPLDKRPSVFNRTDSSNPAYYQKVRTYFPDMKVPEDPKVINLGNTGESGGYAYFNQYYDRDTSNPAIVQSVYYTLGVGLENQPSPEEASNFKYATTWNYMGLRYFYRFNGPTCTADPSKNPPRCY